jgi:hypothetical protein
LFESTDRTGSFLDWRTAAGAKQLRLESAAHRGASAESARWKCERARGWPKTLHWKLHDLPRAIWKR